MSDGQIITQNTVDQVVAYVAERGASEQTIQSLRGDFQGIQFTYCIDDDVCGPKPIYESDDFNLYMVMSSDHCTSFTPAMEAATGLVIAEIDDYCA